jgi:hypothetical protein
MLEDRLQQSRDIIRLGKMLLDLLDLNLQPIFWNPTTDTWQVISPQNTLL